MPVRKRHSIRLQGYDYAEEGAYFITIVTHERVSLFGNVINGEMILNEFGKIVQEEWLITNSLRKNVEIFDDEYCIMPNHFHGIIWITNDPCRDSARRVPTITRRVPTITRRVPTITRRVPTDTPQIHLTTADVPTIPSQITIDRKYGKPIANSLSTIIGAFKGSVTRRINHLRGVSEPPIWQGRFYDHIIRDEKDYEAIANYIALNPQCWEKDDEFQE